MHPALQLGNFDDIDTDGDGVITLDELEGAMTKMLGRKNTVIKQNNEGILYLLKKNDVAFFHGVPKRQ